LISLNRAAIGDGANQPGMETGMAQKLHTLYVDDLDGSDAEGTVRFSLDGAHYEIDLNAAHARELRGALAPYVEAGRKVPRRAGRNRSKATAKRVNSNEIRDWARTNGVEIKNRGRVPANVVTRFLTAGGQ
jgi:nucleoid-associated protein Lsr2